MHHAKLLDVRKIEVANRRSLLAMWGQQSSTLLLNRVAVETPRTGPQLRKLPEDLRELPLLMQGLR
jgi:hypothetical protein